MAIKLNMRAKAEIETRVADSEPCPTIIKLSLKLIVPFLIHPSHHDQHIDWHRSWPPKYIDEGKHFVFEKVPPAEFQIISQDTFRFQIEFIEI